MAVTRRRSRSVSWAVITAVLAVTVLMNYSFTTGHSAAHSSSGIRGAQNARSTAYDSGPLAVTPVLDTARALSAIITTDGGSVTATAANGTAFTLTIPPGALLDQENITVTPVDSIPDLPFSGGLAGGGAVQLGPEGLILLKAATLVIQSPLPLSIDEQSPFAWRLTGEDFHLFPLTLDPTTITMELTRFSGYGAGSGSSGERGAARDHSPSRSQSQFEQQVQKSAEDARKKLSQSPTKKQTKKAVKKYNNDVANLLESTFEGLLDGLKQDLLSGDESALRCRLFNVLQSLVQLHSKGLELEKLQSI